MKFEVDRKGFQPLSIKLTIENIEERRLLEAFLNLDYFMDRYHDADGYNDVLLQIGSDESTKSLISNLASQVSSDSIWSVEDAD